MWRTKGYAERVRMVLSCADPYNSSIKINRTRRAMKRVVYNNNHTTNWTASKPSCASFFYPRLINPNPQEGQ